MPGPGAPFDLASLLSFLMSNPDLLGRGSFLGGGGGPPGFLAGMVPPAGPGGPPSPDAAGNPYGDDMVGRDLSGRRDRPSTTPPPRSMATQRSPTRPERRPDTGITRRSATPQRPNGAGRTPPTRTPVGEGGGPPGGQGGGGSPFYSFEEFSKPNQAGWWKSQQRPGAQVGGDIRGSSPESYYGWLGNAGYRNVRGDTPDWFQSYEDWSRPGQARWAKEKFGTDRSGYGQWLATKNRGA